MQGRGLIPSIEGMRALAVLAVLLFHLDIPVLGGGYLGVDVFFVISGFVITRSILQQSGRGTFDLSGFYRSRFRRLIPALATVTLITLMSAVPLMPAADLEAAGASALYSAVSLSNFLFWSEANYFDAAAHTKPFLHTWSLGVEEQFYLFWPLLLLFFLDKRRLLLPLACAFLAISSAVAAALFVYDHSSAVFFLTPFRVYQFMFGAIIAASNWNVRGVVGSIVHLLGVCGFAGVVVAFSGEDSPLLAGGVAAAASFMMILGRESTAARSLTSNPALMWIGRHSYAIYLVHWPLIVLYKYGTGSGLSMSEQVLLIAGSIIGAMALHRYVERPFRISAKVEDGVASAVATPVTVGLVLVGMFIGANFWGLRGFPEGQSEDVGQVVDAAKSGFNERLRSVRTGRCHVGSGFKFPEDYPEAECAPMRQGGTNVLVIGDSIAADMFVMLREAYPDVTFSQATGGSCGAFVGRARYSACERINDYRFKVLAKREYDYVVVAGYWRSSNVHLLPASIEALKSHGRKVIVIGPGVEFGEDVVRITSMSASTREAVEKIRAAAVRKDAIRQQVRSMAGSGYVDLAQIQCPGECDVIAGGNLLYVDKFHISPAGISVFSKRLAKTHANLFRS